MKRILPLLLLTVCAWAQSDTASLSGTVTDPGAASIPGAKVTLRNMATRNQRTVLSDIQGVYHFSLLIPGSYEISVEATGMKQYHAQDVAVNVAQPARLDVQMEIGNNMEVVEVHTPAMLLSADTAAQGTVIKEDKIVSLPLNGRQFLQLALLVPGANAGGRAVQQDQFRQGLIGGLSVSGGRTNNTAFLLDGAINRSEEHTSELQSHSFISY